MKNNDVYKPVDMLLVRNISNTLTTIEFYEFYLDSFINLIATSSFSVFFERKFFFNSSKIISNCCNTFSSEKQYFNIIAIYYMIGDSVIQI